MSAASVQAVYIVGPTASGKSAVALQLAEQIGGEIISIDSMQVYLDLDIGTAKPTPEERTRIPHHLLDVVDLTEPFDAAKFCQLAKRSEEEIRARGKIPIFCGGTGLYLKAYLEGLGEAPPSDLQLRGELETIPVAELLAELERRDPITFAKIDRKNTRRVIRAIEVIRLTGKPYSDQRAQWSASQVPNQRLFGLRRDVEDLRQRIDRRVDEMFEKGLVEETKSLLTRGLEKNAVAMQAIGYRQVVEHIRGERSLMETIELIKIRTRQFAKRQMTWFRRQLAVQWIDVEPGSGLESAVSHIRSATRL